MRPLLLSLIALAACTGKVEQSNFGGLAGDACDEEETCRTGLACDHEGVCAEEGTAGTFAQGEDCLLTDECGWGLVCDGAGHCAQPGDAGTGDVDAACESDADCQMGFACNDDGACEDLEIPYWEGVQCAADDGPFRVYFEVPDLPASPGVEFYRLPFPNDARLVDGHPDLSGHPSPGDVSPAIDAWLAAMEEIDAYPVNPVVILRTSGRLDPSSVRAFQDDDTLFMAAVSPSSEDYGYRSSFVYEATTARNRYACGNQIRVSSWPGRPLEPDTTYAVWVSRDIRSGSAETPEVDADFAVMMGDARPGDDGDYRLVPAWDAYAPFRQFLDDNGVDRDSVAGAAVFTTGNPARRFWNVGFAVSEAERDPTPLELTLCDGEAISPCDDGGARACGAPQAGFHELHGRITVPVFQEGSAPYAPGDGGWAWNTANTPFLQTGAEVCFALTVPEGAPPAGGWPVTLAAHAWGGDFRDPIELGLAGALAAAPTPDGGTVGVATLTLELPGHGERGEASLFYDLDNPTATYGNRLQAAAELYQAVAVLEAFSLEAGQSPTGQALRFDTDKLLFFGHGAGGEAAIAMLANTRDIQAAVLGGVGGLQGVIAGTRLEPQVTDYELRRRMADTSSGRMHPILGVLQATLERSDAVIYGQSLLKVPAAGSSSKHVLYIYGLDDLTTPDAAQQALQTAMGLPTVGEVVVDWEQSTRDAPASENLLSESGGRYTGGSLQLEGGHEALWSPEGLDAAVRFLGAAAAEQAPSIE
ncbi:MAG: hypothetical protein H6741_30095 [Alphaproteobacteria bacterium]|nr:hypothetical protein [Alphaproteobacteria bacterium]